MMRPRRDVILRRFMNGDSIDDLSYELKVPHTAIEQTIRDALNGKTRIP